MAEPQKKSGGFNPWRWVLLPFRVLFRAIGAVAVVLVLLAFTQVPWKVFEWMGDDGARLPGEPDYIVVMGGGGIPSESGLIRTYAAAEAAARHPKAKVVVAMPGVVTDTNSSAARMRAELTMRGVARPRVIFEDKGRHTREQAVNCFRLFNATNRQPAVLIVSSTEHVRRCLLSFRKAGFTNVAGRAATAEAVEADLRFDTAELKDKPLPDVGQNLVIRYRFWTNLEIEAKCLHEFAALAYYKLLGWI